MAKKSNEEAGEKGDSSVNSSKKTGIPGYLIRLLNVKDRDNMHQAINSTAASRLSLLASLQGTLAS